MARRVRSAADERQLALANRLGGIAEGLGDVFPRQICMRGENLGFGLAIGIMATSCDGYTEAAKAGRAAHLSRVDGNSGEFHRLHF